ncbi:nuclear transport factor 2 family protein [Chitinophaga sp. 30R24]|uniref:nuclear transport factor 2 family protein n=1 Tax=Chitinophaga sp. 30R24 TaxID=3248838 RepID=UPI003B9002D9
MIKKMAIAFLAFILSFSCFAQDTNDITATNKAIIKKGFEDWEKGVGNLFPIVADDVKWTIENYTESTEGFISKPIVYNSKEALLNSDLKTLYAKLDGIIKPKLVGIYADGNTVIAYWEGMATAKDGLPYSNTYVWLIEMEDGKIVKLTAFLNMNVMNKLLNKK